MAKKLRKLFTERPIFTAPADYTIVLLRLSTLMYPCRSLRHGALMPLNSVRLTGFYPPSKLFFAASQNGFSIGTNLSASGVNDLARLKKSGYMMNRNSCHTCLYRLICMLLMVLAPLRAGAQTAPEPVRERLLNGLRVLFWERTGDPNVFIKLRLESGAAFDLAGKGGTMALLGDVLFPDPVTREYVSEQLGGRLDVSTSHDAIEVTISGRANELERIVDFLRGALVTTQVTKENVIKIRESRLQQLSEAANSSPSRIADREIALRLFGAFPYGHPAEGTVESVAKIERPDLMFARERFLNANITTMVVIGGVNKLRLMRTLRQLLGPWQMGTQTVPATFRQPNPPDSRVLLIDQAGSSTAEVRLAVRGLTRADRDSVTASLLARIVRDRLKSASAEFASVFARHEAHDLLGMFVIGASVPATSAAKAFSTTEDLLKALAQSGPTATEWEKARQDMLNEIAQQNSQQDLKEVTADNWLLMELYKLPTESEQVRSLTLADAQRVASKLFKNTAAATIVVGQATQLKANLGANVELRGAKAGMKTNTTPVAPAAKPR
jgi:zinc protease